MANSADPDQLASSEAHWSGSTLFANAGIYGFSRTRVKLSSRIGMILFRFLVDFRLFCFKSYSCLILSKSYKTHIFGKGGGFSFLLVSQGDKNVQPYQGLNAGPSEYCSDTLLPPLSNFPILNWGSALTLATKYPRIRKTCSHTWPSDYHSDALQNSYQAPTVIQVSDFLLLATC